MNIGVVGLGLIGGSFCKAIKKYTDYRVWGYDINENTLSVSLNDKTIDEVLMQDNIKKLDMLFIALYPGDTVSYIENNYRFFPNKLLVCDLCGVKDFVCKYGFEKSHSLNFDFIGCHPMAGKEFSGYEFSDGDLFVGASMILTPSPFVEFSVVEKLKQFIFKLRFGGIVISTPQEHDKIIACTSQLAHVVSSAYVKSKTASSFKGFSAGSFADMTRVAKLNENMWTELFFENKENLINEIDELIDNLLSYRNSFENNEYDKCKQLLCDGRKIKEKFINEEATH